jgi:predicted HD phosphohydrolase
MIVQEHFDVNGRDFIRTHSDANRYVARDGVEYSEACDPAELGRTYTEGDVMPVDEGEAQEILNIILGVDE